MGVKSISESCKGLEITQTNISNELEKLTQDANEIKSYLCQLLSTPATQKMLQCPPDTRCLTILSSVCTIGTLVLGEYGKDKKKSDVTISDYSKSNEFGECIKLLDSCPSLREQLIKACRPLPKTTLDCRADRITMLCNLISEIILWCQISQESGQLVPKVTK